MSLEITLINYGLAGVVVYIFYRLISNELKDLKQSIDRLTESINELKRSIDGRKP